VVEYDDREKFDYGQHTVDLDDESFNGRAIIARLDRGGRTWSCNLDYREFSPTFRADNGIVNGTDNRTINFWTGVTFRPNREWLIEWGPRLSVGRVYTHRATVSLNPSDWESGVRDEWARPELYFNLKGQTNISFGYLASREWFQGSAETVQPFTGISRGFANISSRPTGWIDIGGRVEYGRKVVRLVSEPRMGILTNVSFWGSFRISQRLRILPNYDFQRMTNRDHYMAGSPDADRVIYQYQIFRTRINYQFTREWFLRLIVEYRISDALDESNYLVLEPLLTYRVNPLTMFYIGANWGGSHFENGYEYAGAAGFKRRWLKSTWRLQQASVFAKVQYLFRI
jgi:hypothetical protein